MDKGKVLLKKIEYEPLSITMIDDIQDTFHNFFYTYLSSFSPATRSYNEQTSLAQYETGGFNFKGAQGKELDSARRGELVNGVINPIKAIKVIQVFGHGSAINEFKFINPRILDMSYDELKHEGGDEGNHATVRFDYDVMAFTRIGEEATGQADNAAPKSDYYAPNRGPAGSFKPNGIYNDGGFYSPDFVGGYSGTVGGGMMGGVMGAFGNIASSAVGTVFSSVSAQALSKIGGGALGNIIGNTVAAPITRAVTGAVGNTVATGMYNLSNSNIMSDYFKSSESTPTISEE